MNDNNLNYSISLGNDNLYIQSGKLKNSIKVTTNRAQYYSEIAKKYKDEAKIYRDSAKYYSDLNSDVSRSDLDSMKAYLESQINLKQDAGDYVTNADLDTKQNALTAGVGIEITEDNVINNTQTSAEWGNIEGDIEDQGDLKAFIKSNTSGFEIGDIGTALFVDESKGLRRYLNGQIISINNNTQGFLNWLQGLQSTTPELFTTEQNWQAEHTLNAGGYVDKFVLDESQCTIRLPNYPDYIVSELSGTVPVVGNGMALGITNGGSKSGVLASHAGSYIGAWCSTNANKALPFSLTDAYNTNDFNGAVGVTINPDKSGLIAQLSGNSSTLRMKYFIQIATGTTTENNIINEIELNNPYTLFDCKYSEQPLYNTSWLLSSGQWNAKAVYVKAYEALQVEYNTEIEAGEQVTLPSGTEYVKRGLNVVNSTETYTDYDYVLNTTEETFRLPIKTIKANQTISGLLLYFYIGETVQNSNLIDAGRFSEILATKTDMEQAALAGMPSDRYIDLTLGASGSIYTAPADGYFYINKIAGGDWYYVSFAGLDGKPGALGSDYKTTPIKLLLPVTRGTRVQVDYNATGTTNTFRFYYAEGIEG